MKFAIRENKFQTRYQRASEMIVHLKLELRRILSAKYDSTASKCIIAFRIKSVCSTTYRVWKPRAPQWRIEADVWVEPRFVVAVAAAEITRSPLHTCGKVNKDQGYSLRFPRMVQFRFDRRPEDATTEKEIIDLYRAASTLRILEHTQEGR